MIHAEPTPGARATGAAVPPTDRSPAVTEIGSRKLPYLIEGRRPTYNAAMTPRGHALVAFAALAARAALETCRLGNPDPAPADAPAEQFSASRAIATLGAVSLDEPHPLRPPAHDTVRDRIAAALRALDYTVEVQRTFACNPAACGEVANLIARRPDQP